MKHVKLLSRPSQWSIFKFAHPAVLAELDLWGASGDLLHLVVFLATSYMASPRMGSALLEPEVPENIKKTWWIAKHKIQIGHDNGARWSVCWTLQTIKPSTNLCYIAWLTGIQTHLLQTLKRKTIQQSLVTTGHVEMCNADYFCRNGCPVQNFPRLLETGRLRADPMFRFELSIHSLGLIEAVYIVEGGLEVKLPTIWTDR